MKKENTLIGIEMPKDKGQKHILDLKMAQYNAIKSMGSQFSEITKYL